VFTFGILIAGVVLSWNYTQDQLLISQFDQNLHETLKRVIEHGVLYGGIFISALIALITYLLVRIRLRARALASDMLAELSQSQRWFQKLYEDGPTPYVIVDDEGHIWQPNNAALRLFDGFKEDIAGKSLSSFVPDNSKDDLRVVLERFMRGVAVHNREMRIQPRTGNQRWVLFSLYPMGETGRAPEQGIATLLDITERKQLEEMKTEFVSLASHQLRTPLSAIKWYTDILRKNARSRLDDTQQAYLDQVFESNQRMIELVNMLLNVSRIEMGTVAIQPENMEIGSVIETVLDEVGSTIEEKSLTIKKDYADTPNLYNDPRLVRVIIQNLISNAVKYTQEGGTITVAAEADPDDVTISVSDTGIGIPQDAQDKIFTKMFRAENVRVHDVQGTGLGLYLVRSVVRELGGSISFNSTEGDGTTFWVRLPIQVERTKDEGKSLKYTATA
jgi:two-component system phosphate regulon sensor histidine kinase PhoR